MPEGQVVTQPEGATEQSLAQDAALRILTSEEPKPAVEGDTPPVEEVKSEPEGEQPKTEEETPPQLPKYKFTVKAEGGVDEEVEVDENELKSGYMRYKDYQRKTTEVAREKDSVRDSVKSQTEPKLREYEEKLALYEKAVWNSISPEIQNTDWNKLAQEEPAEWARRMQSVNNVNATLTSIKQEQAKLAQERQSQALDTINRQVQQSQEELRRDIHGWNNELYNNILKTGQEYGFKPEEVNVITDPRAIKVLHDAMKYRELQKAKPAMDKKVVNVPKVSKPGAAGEKPDQNIEKWGKGMTKLKQTGNTKDAVALAAMMLEAEGVK